MLKEKEKVFKFSFEKGSWIIHKWKSAEFSRDIFFTFYLFLSSKREKKNISTKNEEKNQSTFHNK